MRIIINWSFCLILLLLLGSINSIPISESEINSIKNKVDSIKDKVDSIKDSNIKDKDRIVISKEGVVVYDSDKSIRDNIRDNINFKKEKDVKVNKDSIPENTNQQNSSTFFVDDESVPQSTDNNSNVKIEFDKKESNDKINGLDKTNSMNIPFNNSDNGNFNNTVILKENKVAVKEKVKDTDKNEPYDSDKTNESKSNEAEQGEIRSFIPDNSNFSSDNIDNNNNKSSKKIDNPNLNGEKNYMYISGMVMGVFLFLVICNIVIKIKASQFFKSEVPSPNNRTLSLDLESFDSFDLRAGDLDSILSLETMEQYSESNKVYVVDDGNNLKNIAKIYEIKGYKDHIFERNEIGRNDSLNSLFDVSFNDNNSTRSLPYL